MLWKYGSICLRRSRTRKAQKSFGLHQLWITHMWQDVTGIMTMHFVQQTGLTLHGAAKVMFTLCTHKDPLKSAGMTPALKVGLLPKRHAELGREAIINFYMSMFYASYSGQNACALHTCTHCRHVILKCVYTAESSNSICSINIFFIWHFPTWSLDADLPLENYILLFIRFPPSTIKSQTIVCVPSCSRMSLTERHRLWQSRLFTASVSKGS